MIDTERFDAAAYVAAVAPAMGFSFTAREAADVAAALALVVVIAMPALTMEVPPETEPAPVFCP